MIDININFFKELYNEDILYHYTTSSTAIDFILYNEELRFSQRQKSIDPVESIKANRSTFFNTGGVNDNKINSDHYNQSDELIRYISNLEKAFYQICFCKNSMGSDFANKNYITQFKGNEELFGFTKPRMWERYGDNYQGVCLAFSKEKILNRNKNRFKLLHKDVDYLNYIDLNCQKIDDISGNYLAKVGLDQYREELRQTLESSFFCKHIDYSGEDEFRIGVYYDAEKCAVEKFRGEFNFFNSMMLDIQECLEAIFISSFANEQQKERFLKYADKFKVPIIEMVWKHNSFEAINYRDSENLYKSLKM
ncbi:DUF2971 domain-containing protein [uncultured Christiangramia sp.]|uniref:DUF2971 domain-containing protein n=1 Tax=Christiangramia sp. 3-2217-3z TaxID=3417564 RepID=UPI00261DD9D8|nr:DUF2971 domain-containing protein [uncultured Christiangramia sp.]